ncbi:MAG: ATP phosphoribosyltransferase [Ornithinimicrobium sp.]
MAPSAPPRDRLRVAIQRSGRLAAPARDLLASCGLTWRESRDKLFCYGESLAVDLLLVRDDDIPGLIADGVCDLGIVGRNVVIEHDLARSQSAGLGQPGDDGQKAVDQRSDLRELRELGWGRCRLDIAIDAGEEWRGPSQLEGQRIATSYPQVLSTWLAEHNVNARVVTLSGSVEIAPRLGQADVVCDLVSSGATLSANHLKPVATLLHSEAVVVGPAHLLTESRGDLAELLLRRIDGALRLKETRLLMLRTARADLPQVLNHLPEGHEPTILALDGDPAALASSASVAAQASAEVSVQMLVHGAVTWQRLEDLKTAGARQLMVLPVEGMLA